MKKYRVTLIMEVENEEDVRNSAICKCIEHCGIEAEEAPDCCEDIKRCLMILIDPTDTINGASLVKIDCQ